MCFELVQGEEDYWKKTAHALKGNPCLRSLHIHHCSRIYNLSPGWSEMIKSLCRNERLTELAIDNDYNYILKGIHVRKYIQSPWWLWVSYTYDVLHMRDVGICTVCTQSN